MGECVMASSRARVAAVLTGRRGAWFVLAAMVLIASGLMGALRGAEAPSAVQALPTGSESATVADLQQQFPDHELSPVMAVVSRSDGAELTAAQLESANQVGQELGRQVGREASEPIVSTDGQAAVVNVVINADRPNAEIADTIAELRATAHSVARDGLLVQITGGPAFGADIASAFDGANFTLLAVTVGVVAVLLLLTYRSPILWLIPLAVVGLADQVANLVTAKVGELTELPFDTGIISVLVFGAGTNYALLLISRYREELATTDDHRTALARAVQGTAPAILASNVTVVLSLLTLLLAVMPNTRGLGLAAAIGLAIALVFGLVLLPAVLAVCGRRIFWPFIPRPDRPQPARGSVWRRVADAVTRRAVPVLLVTVAGLAVMASGLIGTQVGLSQLEQFRVPSESAAGLETVARHFPAGETAPVTVIAREGSTEQVVQAAQDVAGVKAVRPAGTSDGGLVKVLVVGSAEPSSAASLQMVRDLRTAVHAVPDAAAVVGGQTAEDLDIRTASEQDLLTVAPLIIAVVFILLVVLLRAVLAPVLLVMINIVSAVAAIGAGTWIGETMFGFPALDVNVPLVAFLFLVALGIDYTIFLTHRVRQEAQSLGTRAGVVEAVAHTGAVITSAGIVLAGVFEALGVLPLTTLAQLGLIVGLGVLIDTLLVRTLVVPAVISLVGDTIWWPSRPAASSPPTHP